MKDFSLKFLDIMIGLVLGLGFQWWPQLDKPWQYLAFVFVYLDIIDHWIDYGPTLRKFPPKREVDILLNVAIMFTFFFYIYTTQLDIIYFLASFVAFRLLDFLWLLRSKYEYKPVGSDKTYVHMWLVYDALEMVMTGGLIAATFLFPAVSSLSLIFIYVVVRILIRITASWEYKKIHFA